MSKVDLHLHSCVSDGKYTPAEVVAKAAGLGLAVIALTDHDNIDGIAAALEAARNFPGLKVIPGVEISTDEAEGEVHMLGYFIDYTHPELLATLVKSRETRVGRAQDMVYKLAGLGLPLEWKRVLEIAGDGTIGRPHIARALLEKGYISTFNEAFDKYIGDGGPAYVDRTKITPTEAVEIILRAGGLPVLAHPFTTKNTEALVTRLAQNGLAGIEAYSGKHTPEQVQRYHKLAEKHHLIVTGGSDYHGIHEDTETMMGSLDIPMSAAEKLIARAGQK